MNKYKIEYNEDQEGGHYHDVIHDVSTAIYSILRLRNGGGVKISPRLVNTFRFEQVSYAYTGNYNFVSRYFCDRNWIFSIIKYYNSYYLSLVNDNGCRPGNLTNNDLGVTYVPTYVPNVNYVTATPYSTPVVKYKVDYYDDNDDDDDFDKDYDIEESLRKVNKKSSKKSSKKKGSKKNSKKRSKKGSKKISKK